MYILLAKFADFIGSGAASSNICMLNSQYIQFKFNLFAGLSMKTMTTNNDVFLGVFIHNLGIWFEFRMIPWYGMVHMVYETHLIRFEEKIIYMAGKYHRMDIELVSNAIGIKMVPLFVFMTITAINLIRFEANIFLFRNSPKPPFSIYLLLSSLLLLHTSLSLSGNF